MTTSHPPVQQGGQKPDLKSIDRWTKAVSTSMALSRRGFIKTALASAGALGMYLLGLKPAPASADNCRTCTSRCTSYCTSVHLHCCSPDNTFCVDFDCYCRYSNCQIWCWWPWQAWANVCDSHTYALDCPPCP